MAMETIDDYVAAQPDSVQDVLRQVRVLAVAAVPGGKEAITYQMPTIQRGGRNVLHFAAWKKHLAVYPTPDGDADFLSAIAPYVAHQDTLQFKYADEMPYDLIADVFARLAERT